MYCKKEDSKATGGIKKNVTEVSEEAHKLDFEELI